MAGAKQVANQITGNLKSWHLEPLRRISARSSAKFFTRDGERRYATKPYEEPQQDGSEDVLGAGNASQAGKSDAVGEEMRVDSFVNVDNVDQTDGDGIVDKAKKGMKKVGEKLLDMSETLKGAATKDVT